MPHQDTPYGNDRSIFPAENAQHDEVMLALHHIGQRLDALEQGQVKIMSKMDDFKTQLAAYVASVNAYITAANANQQTSDQAVAAAVAADKAGEDVDIQALSDTLTAAAAQVSAAPTAAPTVPASPTT